MDRHDEAAQHLIDGALNSSLCPARVLVITTKIHSQGAGLANRHQVCVCVRVASQLPLNRLLLSVVNGFR